MLVTNTAACPLCFVLLLLFEDLIVLCLVLELFSLLSKEISCSSCRTRKHAIILGVEESDTVS